MVASPPNWSTMEQRFGTVGSPIPNTEMKIVNYEDGKIALPYGGTGEICVRGPQVMQGYWDDPEATESVLSPDGWLRTGDIGRFDENGHLKIVGRVSKDLIKVEEYLVG